MDVEMPDWMADAWTVRRDGEAAAMVRTDFVDAFERTGLIEAARRPPEELAPGARPFRPGGGRGGLAVLPAGRHGEAVVRPYRRGGFAARFVERTYLMGDRAFHEAEVTERLHRGEVAVPKPLAAIQAEHGLGYRAALVTLRVTGAEPAPEVLHRLGGADEADAERADGAGAGDRPARRSAARRGGADADGLRDALRRMGRSAGKLHAAGCVHADLNAHNFLLPRGGGDAVVLDFDRARVVGGRVPRLLAWMNLRRLRRSLDGLGLSAALEAWDAFEEAYEEAVGPDEGDGPAG